jgi:NAD(P)-dependent dehydrogenase (short-subunit alcohol dehydrogenase family)
MTMDWPAGEAAFVTGAASGIGRGIARALVAARAKVALTDIDQPRLAAVARELSDAGGTVIPLQLDVSDADQWPDVADRAEEALGPISILVNNAGVAGPGAIDETTLEVWRWVHRVNLEAQFIGVLNFLPRFKSRARRAHILNTSSMAGIVPMTHVAAYCSSKFASFGFSMVLRDELQGTDIGTSVLCPGRTATRIRLTDVELRAKMFGEQLDSAVVESSARPAGGADPDRVGEQVVQAMQRRQFLIITHLDWEPLVKRVHAEVDGAFREFDDRHGPDDSARMLLDGKSPVVMRPTEPNTG